MYYERGQFLQTRGTLSNFSTFEQIVQVNVGVFVLLCNGLFVKVVAGECFE